MELLFFIVLICILCDVGEIKNSIKNQNSKEVNVNSTPQVNTIKEMELPSLPKEEKRNRPSVWYFGDLDMSFLKK